MNKAEPTARVSRNPLPLIDDKVRRISEEALASLRAYRLNRVSSRALPHQAKAA